jgi:hypothetical protein
LLIAEVAIGSGPGELGTQEKIAWLEFLFDGGSKPNL